MPDSSMFKHELEPIKVTVGQTLLLLMSRILLFWALARVRYLGNHKNSPLSFNDGYTGFGANAGENQPNIENLYWQHACSRYQYRRWLTLFRYHSRNRLL